jgi:hypothetical protein
VPNTELRGHGQDTLHQHELANGSGALLGAGQHRRLPLRHLLQSTVHSLEARQPRCHFAREQNLHYCAISSVTGALAFINGKLELGIWSDAWHRTVIRTRSLQARHAFHPINTLHGRRTHAAVSVGMHSQSRRRISKSLLSCALHVLIAQNAPNARKDMCSSALPPMEPGAPEWSGCCERHQFLIAV